MTSIAAALAEMSDNEPADHRGLTHISVMSYNVFFHPLQGQDREARRFHMLDALSHFEDTFGRPLPDVVAFQEVDDAFVEDKLLASLYPHRTERVLMNMIASKLPILEFRHFEAQPGNMYVKLDASANPDGAAEAKSQTAKPAFVHLLNVHLFAGDFQRGHNERMAEYEALRNWISAIGIPANEPVIIAGDFNDETGDIVHMKDWHLEYDKGKTGTFDEEGKYWIGSWSSRINWLVALHFQSKYKHYPKGYTQTIDYVVYDKRHLIPEVSKEMEVLLLKGRKRWEYRCEGPMPWCAPKAMQSLKGTWGESTWYEPGEIKKLYHGILEKPDNLYDELSDHFPVIQDYSFRF